MKQQKCSEKILFLFGVGFILGIILGNFFLGNLENEAGVMSSYFLGKFEYLEIDNGQLFFYVLSERSKVFFALAILGITSIGYWCMGVYTLWMGSSIGCFFSICVMRMGVVGLGIGVLSLFPQYLVYVPVYIILFLSIRKMEERKNYMNNDGKKKLLVYMVIVVVCALVMLFGVFLESYVNSYLLKKLLQLV